MFLPISTSRATDDLVIVMALAHTTILTTSSSESTQFTVLVDGSADPVDARIPANSLVEGVDHDDFKVFVDRVLSNPIGVEYS